MKFEDINSDKFSKFEGMSFDLAKSVIGGKFITERPGTNLVDYYETHTGSGGDGDFRPFTANGNDSYQDGYHDLP